MVWLEFLKRAPMSEYHQLNRAMSFAGAYVDIPPISFEQFCAEPTMAWKYVGYCVKDFMDKGDKPPAGGYMPFQEFLLKNTD
uniref:Uncharacterized protein n=1 Tax=viral metagenome TaxID=1070528 RepID=A0A6C0JIQ0_9ZZZZ